MSQQNRIIKNLVTQEQIGDIWSAITSPNTEPSVFSKNVKVQSLIQKARIHNLSSREECEYFLKFVCEIG